MTETLQHQLNLIGNAIFLAVMIFGVLIVTVGSLRKK